MTMQTDVKLDYVGNTLPPSLDYIAASQTPPPIGEPFILTNTEFSDGTSRHITYTTSAAQAVDVILGLTFINENGVELTRYFSLPALPSTAVVTTQYCERFVKAFVYSGTPTTDVSIGMIDDSIVKNIGKGGPIRLRGYSICSSSIPGEILFFSKNPNPTPFTVGTLSFKAQTAQNISLDYPIPGDGIPYKNGLYVLYNPINSQAMNVFYD